MSKKLTPLKALHKIANIEMKEQYKAVKGGFAYRVVSDECSKELNIIKTTLENYDNLLEKYDFKDVKELDDFLHEHRFIHQEQLDNAKKLEAWEMIKNDYLFNNALIGNEIEIIETALKDYVVLEQANKRLNEIVVDYLNKGNVRKLKALEILRRIIACDDDKAFPEYQENDIVTKEEYDLLKEVLL